MSGRRKDARIKPNTKGCCRAIMNWLIPFEGETIELDDVIEHAQTGDLLLWRANTGWWTEFWTASPFSHVSMVYRNPETQKVYQWQSTTDAEEEDLLTGEMNRKGTQLMELRQSIIHYAEKFGDLIAWRPLVYWDEYEAQYTRDIPHDALSHINETLVREMHHMKGYGFQHDPRDMTGGMWFNLYYCCFPLGRKADFDSRIFCAPLVAHALQRAGVLQDGMPIQNYSPSHFDYSTSRLVFTEHWGFGDSYRITFAKSRKKD